MINGVGTKKKFKVANVEGWTQRIGQDLRIHIYGSGSIKEKRIKENDWFRTNFFALPFGVGHLGYAIAAMRVAEHLHSKITRSASIHITGHSMGGSIAEMLAAGLGMAGFIASAENYGGAAPWKNIWWARIAGGAADITWFTCGNDIVPWVPPWFRHAGKHVHLRRVSWNPVKNHVHGYTETLNS